ncbi:MAG: hypothetical protein WB805_16060 [Candidatus Dormiibacterota bacterium]
MSNTRRDAETQSPDRPEATGTRDKGATALPASIDKEKTPQFHPQTAREVVEKVKQESSEGAGIVGKAKAALEEVDRQVAGEYEKREDRVGTE